MALPPTPLYILCEGSSENIYMNLKINKCLSIYGLNNKNKFILESHLQIQLHRATCRLPEKRPILLLI